MFRPYMPRKELVSVWRSIMVIASIIPIVSYYAVDVHFLNQPYLGYSFYFRLFLAVISAITLLASFYRKGLIIKFWWVIHVMAVMYYIYFAWLDYVAVNPEESRYYFGIFQVSIAVLALRISKLNIVTMVLAIFVYVLFNFDAPQLYDAVFDLLTIVLLLWVVFRNLERLRRSERKALRQERKTRILYLKILKAVQEIDHDLKPSLLFMAKYSGQLKYRLRLPRDKEMAKLIQYYSWFVFTHVCNILDISFQKKNVDDISESGSSLLIRAFHRAANAVSYKSSAIIDSGNLMLRMRRLRVRMPHNAVVRVLTNLLDNAVRYTSTLDAIIVEGFELQNEVVILIKNKINPNGKRLESVYESPNHGLGLESSYRIMERFNGKLDFELEDDYAQARLVLPLTDQSGS